MSDSGLDTALIERRIAAIGTKVDQMTTKVDKVESQMEEVRKDLKKLRKDFLEMMLEQRRTAALEQATTELVSVRQEMDKKFGNYSVVRNTMVGILQATDAALVRKATISTVSEELMISTPDYCWRLSWLPLRHGSTTTEILRSAQYVRLSNVTTSTRRLRWL